MNKSTNEYILKSVITIQQ